MGNSRKDRPTKRDLIRWDEDKDVQILLAIVHHCNRKGAKIPWEEVAREIGPKVTGNAVMQHIAKLRKKRETQGLRTPAVPQKRAPPRAGAGKRRRGSSEETDVDQGEWDSDASYGAARTTVKRTTVRRQSGQSDAKTANVSTAKAMNAVEASGAPAIKPESESQYNDDVDEDESPCVGTFKSPGSTSASNSVQGEDDDNQKKTDIAQQLYVAAAQAPAQPLPTSAPAMYYGYPQYAMPPQSHPAFESDMTANRSLAGPPPFVPYPYSHGMGNHGPGAYHYGMHMGGMPPAFPGTSYLPPMQYQGTTIPGYYPPYGVQTGYEGQESVNSSHSSGHEPSRLLESPIPMPLQSPVPEFYYASYLPINQELEDLNAQEDLITSALSTEGSHSGNDDERLWEHVDL